jgi:hypothetical protein
LSSKCAVYNVHAALAEKLAGFQNRDDSFLALLGKLDPALLNTKHRVGGFALLEYVLVFLEFKNGLPRPDFRKERLRIELIIVLRRQKWGPLVRVARFSGSIFPEKMVPP